VYFGREPCVLLQALGSVAYNYDSTAIRLQFDGATTIRRSTLRLGCCIAA